MSPLREGPDAVIEAAAADLEDERRPAAPREPADWYERLAGRYRGPGVDRVWTGAYDMRMQVSQTAYDRFTVALPPADARFALADRGVAAEIAAWLWEFGPRPLVALVDVTTARPEWLGAWQAESVNVRWKGGTGTALTLASRDDLERFLAAGAPHVGTTLVWPRRGPAKTLEALSQGGSAWLLSVDAYAQVERGGDVVEVTQQP